MTNLLFLARAALAVVLTAGAIQAAHAAPQATKAAAYANEDPCGGPFVRVLDLVTGWSVSCDLPIIVNGKVASMETAKGGVVLHVMNAADGRRWSVSVRTSDRALQAFKPRAGDEIAINAYQTDDKSCQPECKASGWSVTPKT